MQINGAGGLPASGVSAVAVNITVTAPTAAGFITAYPDGQAKPTVSNLNFAAKQTIPNLAIVPVGADGKIRLFNGSAGTVHLLADVAGYYLTGTATVPGAFTAVGPARILDTRSGLGGSAAAVAAGGSIAVQINGAGGLPASGVSAVAVNITVTAPTAAGFITAYPDGQAKPTVSNLNFAAKQTIPNLAIVPVGADGKIRLFNGSAGTVHLLADVAGYYLTGTATVPGAFTAVGPARILDTRSGLGGSAAAVAAGGSIAVQINGAGGLPASGVSAVAVNITVTAPTAAGFITAYPDGQAKPTVSNLNFAAKQTIPNLAIVPVGADGKIRLFNGSAGTVHLLADVAGYYLTGTATYPDTVLADHPAVYYRLGEKAGTIAADSSGNHHDGSYVAGNSIQGVAGAIADGDGAIEANGTAAVTGPSSALPTGGAARTLELWVKSPNWDHSTVLSYGSGDGSTQIWLQFGSSSDIHFGNPTTGSVGVDVPFAWSDDNWHLVDATYANGAGSLYIDGVLLASNAFTLASNVDEGVSVGNARGSATSYDEVAVYPSALSADRVAAHWSRGGSTHPACVGAVTSPYATSVLADSPTVFYRLGDRADGRVAFDSSRNCRNGAFVPVTVGSRGALAGDADGAVNSSSFATQTVMGTGSGLPTGNAPRTLELWTRSSNYDHTRVLAYGSDDHMTQIYLSSASASDIHFTGASGQSIGGDVPFQWVDGVWHLIDATYANGTASLYVDGQLLTSGSISMDSTADQGLRIGNGRGSDVSYDEVAVYPSALSADRVAAHWSRGGSTHPACVGAVTSPYATSVLADSPTVFYRLGDRADGRVAFDSSRNCRNGAFVPVTVGSRGALAGDADGAVNSSSFATQTVMGTGSGLPTGNAPRTLELWTRSSNYDHTRVLAYGSDDHMTQIYLSSASASDIHFTGASGQSIGGDVPFQWVDGVWHLIDATYANGTASLYVDGQLLTSGSISMDSTADQGLRIGNGRGSDVSYDEVAVYPSALSPARIAAHYLASGNASPSGGPLGPRENSSTGNLSERCQQAVIHGCGGDPVDLESGTFGEAFTDLAIIGRGPGLDWSRSYSSAAAAQSGPLGYGWSGSYGAHLTTDPDTGAVEVVQEDGSEIIFAAANGVYTAPPRVQATLTRRGDGSFTLLRKAVQSLQFDTQGRLTSISDRNGIPTVLTYSGTQLSAATDTVGGTLTFTWSGGRISKVADPTGRAVSYTYTGTGNLATATAVDGAVTTFGYDSAHRLVSMLDPAQAGSASPHPLTNVYDTTGRVVAQTDPLGRRTTFAYGGDSNSAGGGTTLVTDPAGHQTLSTYRFGQRASVVSGYGSGEAVSTSFLYDPDTLGVTQTWSTTAGDPNNHLQKFAYNAQGLPVTEVDGLGNTTTRTYNGLGELLTSTTPNPSSTGPDTVTTTNTYDGHGNLLSTSSPLYTSTTLSTARKTTYTRGDTNRPDLVTSITDPLGAVSTYTYDAAGDQMSSTSAEGRKTTHTYDTVGRILTTVTPQGNVSGATPSRFTTTYTYDNSNRVLTQTVANGNTPAKTITTYDLDGRTLTVTDPAGRKTMTIYDLAGQTIQLTRADGTVLKTSYWPDGAIKGQTDGAGRTTTYEENAVGQIVSTADPLGRTTSSTFDATGNALIVTDAAGEITTHAYDNDSQETTRTYSSTTTHGVTQVYNRAGVRTSMTDGTGTSTWTADSLGRLITHQSAGGTVSYGYDLNNHVIKIGYPSTKSVVRTFGADGEMTGVTDFSGAKTSFAYTPDGLLSRTSTPNGVTSTNSYNDQDQLTAIDIAKGANALARLGNTRNTAGEVTTEQSTGLNTSNQTYGYNALGQLSGNGTSQIAYDAADNITSVGDGSEQRYDSANEVTSRTVGTLTTAYSYNQSGSRITAGTTTYTYNQEQQLTSYASGTSKVSYTYDGDGLRQGKTASTTSTAFVYDTAEGLPLILQDGASTYIYGPTGIPIEQIGTDNKTIFLHVDQIGSVRLLTNAAGATVGTASYLPFGLRKTTGAVTPFAFAGQYQDGETGLIWMRSRYYDATTAQFITTDPLQSVTRSPYSYSGNDPINEIDPSGLVSDGTLKLLKQTQEYSGYVGAASVVCDGLVITLEFCGPAGLVAGGVETASSLALYYYCGKASDLLDAATTIGFAGLGRLAAKGAEGAEDLVKALHAREADKLRAARDLLSDKVAKVVDFGYFVGGKASSLDDRFNRGVGKIKGLI